MKFHEVLRTLLKQRELTLRQVTVETGIRRSTLSDWLSGSRPRDLEEVRTLSRFFGVTLEQLLFGDEPSRAPQAHVELHFDGPVRIRIDRADGSKVQRLSALQTRKEESK
jgi:transcriptional regulator with XRE-family HTH domain